MLPGMAQKFLMQKQSETIRIGGATVGASNFFLHVDKKKILKKRKSWKTRICRIWKHPCIGLQIPRYLDIRQGLTSNEINPNSTYGNSTNDWQRGTSTPSMCGLDIGFDHCHDGLP